MIIVSSRNSLLFIKIQSYIHWSANTSGKKLTSIPDNIMKGSTVKYRSMIWTRHYSRDCVEIPIKVDMQLLAAWQQLMITDWPRCIVSWPEGAKEGFVTTWTCIPKTFFSMSRGPLGITSTRLSTCRCVHVFLRGKIRFITKPQKKKIRENKIFYYN